MLKELIIEGLFGLFNYNIKVNDEGLTIITGPNGYGKTTLLKILYFITNLDNPLSFYYFFTLSFNKIEILYNESNKFSLEKKEPENDVLLINNNGKSESIYLLNLISIIESNLINKGFIKVGAPIGWLYDKGKIDKTYPSLGLIISELLSDKVQINHNIIDNFPDTKSYFIGEQRLLKKRYNQDNFIATINEYANELKQYITDTLAKSSQIVQQLDSTFPKRLFEETSIISEEEFIIRFKRIKETQKMLNDYGLFSIQEDNHPTYKPENAKALFIYIKDTEEKLKVFSDLLQKLDLFVNILNERRFSFKTIKINSSEGFIFETFNGDRLELTDLSSGEQQEVVILYELLFKVEPYTLVLIDEPEISLHVAWQKEFINDLQKIIKLKNINFILATHSPDIINDKWDLTKDLYELQKK